MINVNDGGGNVTINGGKTWTEQDYITTQLYHVMTTSDVPYHVAGAQQDNSTVAVPVMVGVINKLEVQIIVGTMLLVVEKVAG
jgi:hypothetical protein